MSDIKNGKIRTTGSIKQVQSPIANPPAPGQPLHITTRGHRRHPLPQPPAYTGPSSQSLVITSGITPITVRYQGRVRQYSRHEIAKGTNTNTSHISYIFSGKRSPSLAMAICLADFLGVSLDYLINELIPECAHGVHEVVNKARAEILSKRERASEQ